jgi:RNA polymerase sigma-70 factor (ECF subfamily)
VASQESADTRPFEPAGVTDNDGSDARLRRLVQSAQDGEAEAFGAIFDEFHLPVYRYIVARVGNPADAEDLAADAFAAAFRTIGSFRWQGAPFEAWLFRIARSKIVDHYRRRDRRVTNPLSGFESTEARASDPAAAILLDEERGQLLAAVRRLSPDQQEVVALRFFADLPVPEVARVMDRSRGAVRQLQLRALTVLRQRMEWLR